MKKYFYLIFVALFATMSFTLVSCGDDDAPNAPTTDSAVTINGVKYNVYTLMSYDGYWSSNGESNFSFFAYLPGEESITPYSYNFVFTSSQKPKVGDDLAQRGLMLDPILSHFQDDATMWDPSNCEFVKFSRTAGSAVVTAIEDGTMTIQFSNLKMEGHGQDPISYTSKSFAITIDGKVTVDFTI